MEMPESLVEEELDRQMNELCLSAPAQRHEHGAIRQDDGGRYGHHAQGLPSAAEKQAKVDVTLQAIVKAEGLEVSDEEVEAEYQSLADTYQMELEKVKALAGRR